MIGNDAPTDPIRGFTDRLRRMEQQVAELLRQLQRSAPEQTYTPALTAVTVNPNIGSTGTRTGHYTLVDGMCHWTANIAAAGAGQASGTGDYRLSLPVAPLRTGTNEVVGAGTYIASLGLIVDALPGTTIARLILTGTGVLSSAHYTSGFTIAVAGSYRYL